MDKSKSKSFSDDDDFEPLVVVEDILQESKQTQSESHASDEESEETSTASEQGTSDEDEDEEGEGEEQESSVCCPSASSQSESGSEQEQGVDAKDLVKNINTKTKSSNKNNNGGTNTSSPSHVVTVVSHLNNISRTRSGVGRNEGKGNGVGSSLPSSMALSCKEGFVEGKLSVISISPAPKINFNSSIITTSKKIEGDSGLGAAQLSRQSPKTLQKMPSVDFKPLSKPIKSGDLTLHTGSGLSGGLINKGLGKIIITDMEKASKNEATGVVKKPAVKPKPKTLERLCKNFCAQNPSRPTTESSTEVDGGNKSISKTSSAFAGLPPMSPQSIRETDCRDYSPVRSKPSTTTSSNLVDAGVSTTATYAGPGTAWTLDSSTRRSVRSLLSPVRQINLNPQIVSTDSLMDESELSSHKNQSRKRVCNTKKGYASSLPDRDGDQWATCSSSSTLPFTLGAFDLNYPCDYKITSSQNKNGSTNVLRGHPRPTKNCKNKHLWARASLERELASVPPPSPQISLIHGNNRHSSYHPSVDSSENAAAAAAAAAYNHVLQNSRSNSPLICQVGGDGTHSHGPMGRSRCRSVCSDSEFDNSCRVGCSTRTFPRSSNRLAGIKSNCHCCCHHHCEVGTGSLGGSLLGLDYEDRLLRLESDKDTLHLQVSVLGDQIEAQTSKIHDLEKLLDDKKNVLETTEDQLQRELITRSGLETQKLELMTEISGLRFKQATLERENLELKGQMGKSMTELNWPPDRIWDKPPTGPPLGVRGTSPALTAAELGQRLRLTSNDSGQSLMHHHQQRVQTPPSAYRRLDQSTTFGTLPRRSQPSALSTFNSAGVVSHPVDSNRKANSLSSGNIHAISGVNFNKTNDERDDWPRGDAFNNYNNSSTANTKNTTNGGHKPRKILRILGKLKRSNSGGLDNEVVPETHGATDAPPNNPFSRGGLRATAAPRLGWVKEQTSLKMPDRPITSWDSEDVVTWLNYLGLGIYANEIKRWVKSGQQLLDASSQELEKELNIKNALHRKKLNLALHYLKHPDEEDNAGKLDHGWVTRWLDDVGLPQYKESFSDARVDGRILSHLNSFDLTSLKVTSLLHHASIKRGIQILRIHRFHPSCLCRRGSTAGIELSKDPKHVATWSNHRVMEWLKAVDLAEYAPNLRGSGVHGALIVFEPRFNAELLATLLSIPSNKTLLRRHLSLQFNELVGKYIVQEKRLVEIAPDFIPINPTVKVKPQKKSQFPLRKKRFSNEFSEELLCPIEFNVFPNWGSQTQLNSNESSGSFSTGGKVSNL